jgi:hypothetical protein
MVLPLLSQEINIMAVFSLFASCILASGTPSNMRIVAFNFWQRYFRLSAFAAQPDSYLPLFCAGLLLVHLENKRSYYNVISFFQMFFSFDLIS